MKSVFLRACALGSLLGLAVLPQAARADIVFSNFSPASGSGYSLSALAINGAGTVNGYRAFAASFTPTRNYSLTAFQVAVCHRVGANSYRFSLVRDNGGLPTGASVVAPFASAVTGTLNGGGEINSFAVSGTLLSGNVYWLVMEPGANDTMGGWFANSTGQTGVSSSGAPGSWSATLLQTPAFRIEGVVIPEPGSLALLALGAGAFPLARRRRTP